MPTRLITIIERYTAIAIATVLIVTAFAASIAEEPAPAKSSKLNFRRDVFPILSQRCWECHLGGDASSGIRLDVRDEWLGETTGRPLVVIGKSHRSRVIEVLEGRDPKVVMPAEGDRLKPAEITLLRQWIDDGLVWDDELLPTPKVRSDHWAFQSIVRPIVKNLKSEISNLKFQNPIDLFVSAKHRELGVQPAHEADRRTLIRRLSLDLLGLPPNRDDAEEFVKDSRPDAYEQLVDRLLASPA